MISRVRLGVLVEAAKREVLMLEEVQRNDVFNPIRQRG
jgi:hypothetical protein